MISKEGEEMYKLYLAEYHLATFNRLSDLDDYVYFLVQSLSNNYTRDSFRVAEVKKRWLRKSVETDLDFNTIAYWLDNGMAK